MDPQFYSDVQETSIMTPKSFLFLFHGEFIVPTADYSKREILLVQMSMSFVIFQKKQAKMKTK